MSEHKEPIPSRLYNAAIGGHVTGADQIIDDETGLTLDEVASGALEGKTYTSDSDNGMGRVVLRKNLINGVNTLVQTMINKSNTIYIIQYDFVLGENITVPENCVLEFEGGSLSNGTLVGNNTQIIAAKIAIFTGIVIAGTWNVPEITSAWFSDATNENKLKDVFALQDENINNIVTIEEGDYYVSNTANERVAIDLKSNTECIILGNVILKPNSLQRNYIFRISEVVNVKISGSGSIIGDRYEHDYESEALRFGPKVLSTDAANTPIGCDLYKDGEIIPGELVASASIVGNVYWIKNALDTPDKYIYRRAYEYENQGVIEYGFEAVNTHETGHGIYIWKASNVEISGITIKECTGDGIFIDGKRDEENNVIPTKEFRISDFYITDCRRQGISIVCASIVSVTNGRISNIVGTNPMSAIDIEPGGYGYCEDIIIENLIVDNPGTTGFKIQIKSGHYERRIENVIISHCFIRAFAPIIVTRSSNITIQNCYIYGSRYYSALRFTEVDLLSVIGNYIDDYGDDKKLHNYENNPLDILIHTYYNPATTDDKIGVFRDNVINSGYKDAVFYTEQHLLIERNFITSYGLQKDEEDITNHPGDLLYGSKRECSIINNNISTKNFTITEKAKWRNNNIETEQIINTARSATNVLFEGNVLSVTQQQISAIALRSSTFINNKIDVHFVDCGFILDTTSFKGNTVSAIISGEPTSNAFLLRAETSFIENIVSVTSNVEPTVQYDFGVYCVIRLANSKVFNNNITCIGKYKSISYLFSMGSTDNNHYEIVDNVLNEVNTEDESQKVLKNGIYSHVQNDGYIKDPSSNVGTTEQRPVGENGYLPKGHTYYDTTLEKLVNWNGDKWASQDGFTATKTYGDTKPEIKERGGILDINKDISFKFFDQNLGIPVFFSCNKIDLMFTETQNAGSWGCIQNTLTEGVVYSIYVVNSENTHTGNVIFGFAKNSNPTDDDILTIFAGRDGNFVGVDPSVYPYIYIKNLNTLSKRICRFYTVREWTESDSATAGVARSGETRPNGSDIYVGFMFMDTTLEKPIYASAISGDTVTWVDATGTPV